MSASGQSLVKLPHLEFLFILSGQAAYNPDYKHYYVNQQLSGTHIEFRNLEIESS